MWAADENNRLTKKPVVLGEHDVYELKYEILDGITEFDYIAFPSASLEEGLPTKPGTLDETITYEEYSEEDGEYDETYDEEYMDDEFADDEEFYMDDEFGEDSVEIYDDTMEWSDDEGMMESYGDEPYVIDDSEVYIIDDMGEDFDEDYDEDYDNIEIIEDFPEEEMNDGEEK